MIMTKYVLNSGGLKNNPQRARDFFAEMLKGLGDKPRILICCFAQPREIWEQNFAKDKDNSRETFPEGVEPVFELAFPDMFKEQIQKADVLYMHGGDDHLIKYWLEKFDIPNIWEGKVVATSSASSHVLSKHFWTCDWRKCMDGLGILPIKFLAHYKSEYGMDDPRGPVDWEQGYKELEAYGDTTLPIHALEEGDYIVIEA